MSEEVLRTALAALEPPLERHRVKDDGNSLFRAIAHQLNAGEDGAEERHGEFRAAAVAELREHRELYEGHEQLVYGGVATGFRYYCDRLARHGEFGGALELQALANCGNLCIRVINAGPMIEFTPRDPAFRLAAAVVTVTILRHTKAHMHYHYDSTAPMGSADARAARAAAKLAADARAREAQAVFLVRQELFLTTLELWLMAPGADEKSGISWLFKSMREWAQGTGAPPRFPELLRWAASVESELAAHRASVGDKRKRAWKLVGGHDAHSVLAMALEAQVAPGNLGEWRAWLRVTATMAQKICFAATCPDDSDGASTNPARRSFVPWTNSVLHQLDTIAPFVEAHIGEVSAFLGTLGTAHFLRAEGGEAAVEPPGAALAEQKLTPADTEFLATCAELTLWSGANSGRAPGLWSGERRGLRKRDQAALVAEDALAQWRGKVRTAVGRAGGQAGYAHKFPARAAALQAASWWKWPAPRPEDPDAEFLSKCAAYTAWLAAHDGEKPRQLRAWELDAKEQEERSLATWRAGLVSAISQLQGGEQAYASRHPVRYAALLATDWWHEDAARLALNTLDRISIVAAWVAAHGQLPAHGDRDPNFDLELGHLTSKLAYAFTKNLLEPAERAAFQACEPLYEKGLTLLRDGLKLGSWAEKYDMAESEMRRVGRWPAEGEELVFRSFGAPKWEKRARARWLALASKPEWDAGCEEFDCRFPTACLARDFDAKLAAQLDEQALEDESEEEEEKDEEDAGAGDGEGKKEDAVEDGITDEERCLDAAVWWKRKGTEGLVSFSPSAVISRGGYPRKYGESLLVLLKLGDVEKSMADACIEVELVRLGGGSAPWPGLAALKPEKRAETYNSALGRRCNRAARWWQHEGDAGALTFRSNDVVKWNGKERPCGVVLRALQWLEGEAQVDADLLIASQLEHRGWSGIPWPGLAALQDLDAGVIWETKMKLLQAHVSAAGVLPPLHHPALSAWINKQRSAYRAWKEGKQGSGMDAARAAVLEAVPGWNWTVAG